MQKRPRQAPPYLLSNISMAAVNETMKTKIFAKKADLVLLLNSRSSGFDFPKEKDNNPASLELSPERTQAAWIPATPSQIELHETEHAEVDGEVDGIGLEDAPSEVGEAVAEDVLEQDTAEDVCERHDRSSLIELHVSAMHLTEASKYFEALLTGQFREACRDAGAIRRVPLEDIYAPAFMLLMEIAHSRYHNLPARVDAEMLFQLCILIDMYDMHELTILQTDL